MIRLAPEKKSTWFCGLYLGTSQSELHFYTPFNAVGAVEAEGIRQCSTRAVVAVAVPFVSVYGARQCFLVILLLCHSV